MWRPIMYKPFTKIITDKDVGFGEKGILSQISRVSCHGIVLCKDMKSIAMVYHGRKCCYTLPGGGIETGETKEQAFLREIKEETGILCDEIEFIGHTEEHKVRTKYLLYCNWFIAKEIGRGENHLCENEVKKKLEFIAVPIHEVRGYLEVSYAKCEDYRRRFIQFRDLYVWDYIQEHNLLQQKIGRE